MKKIIFCFLVSFFIMGCFDDGGSPESTVNPVTGEIVKTFEGTVEKGPFQQGAEITAYSWDPVSGLTGESFTTTTTDDYGSYSLKSSKIKDALYVKAEGYFFNEYSGVMSDSTLKMYGIVDSSKGDWNINIVTHIIHKRVMYLMENGSLYSDAINQSMTELLSGLDWTVFDPNVVDVSSNPQLLFLSASICKDRTVAEVSNLLTQLSSDLEDGVIDISVLDTDFSSLDPSIVEANMTTQYGSSPSLASVKSQVLTYRGIPDFNERVITVQTLPDADFFVFTSSNGHFWKFYTNEFTQINANYTQTYMGVTENMQGVCGEIFTVGEGSEKIIYFTVKLVHDYSEMIHCKQENGIVTEIAELPSKPVRPNIIFNDGEFESYIDAGNTWVRSISTGVTKIAGTLYTYHKDTDFIYQGTSFGEGIFFLGESGSAFFISTSTTYTTRITQMDLGEMW